MNSDLEHDWSAMYWPGLDRFEKTSNWKILQRIKLRIKSLGQSSLKAKTYFIDDLFGTYADFRILEHLQIFYDQTNLTIL